MNVGVRKAGQFSSLFPGAHLSYYFSNLGAFCLYLVAQNNFQHLDFDGSF